MNSQKNEFRSIKQREQLNNYIIDDKSNNEEVKANINNFQYLDKVNTYFCRLVKLFNKCD